ncbi:MAG: hypothetical protein AABY84_08550 [Candidatus Firestonebacteria bacterium]
MDALLCNSCGFGNKAEECVKCGQPFASITAKLCDNCGFGNKANECVKCSQPFASTLAKLCNTCGFGKENYCVKCGQYVSQ